jgi:protein involved in polysaccharide export with SLBB domain
MAKPARTTAFRWTVQLAALLLTGCSVSGNGLIFFPEGHKLLDATKAVRQTTAEPLPLPRELDKRVLPPYIVEPGDSLLVQPTNLESPVHIPADQPVLLDGTIDLGRYGRVIVAGRTAPEIEALVRETIRATDKDPGVIDVRIVGRVSKVYYVLGEVNAPGSFPLSGRETVLDGIIAAGGLNDRASRGNIILSRPTPPGSCRVVLPVCYGEIVQLGDTTTNYQLAPGDRIFVPTRQSHSLFRKQKEDCPPCGGQQAPSAAPTAGCGLVPGPAYSTSHTPAALDSAAGDARPIGSGPWPMGAVNPNPAPGFPALGFPTRS